MPMTFANWIVQSATAITEPICGAVAEAIYLDRERLGSLPLPQALESIGTMLVMSVGGASGPLYGTLLIEIGRRLGARQSGADFANILGEAIDAVARRGRAQAGDKTLLDVLYPVHTEMIRQSALVHIAERAEKSAQLTAGMKAMRGRASFWGIVPLAISIRGHRAVPC